MCMCNVSKSLHRLLDMIDVTLKQLDAESRPSASLKRAPHKKQVHFEEPSYIKKVKKTPVSLWHHKQGDWKKNKKLKVSDISLFYISISSTTCKT